jgi:hypothetical protein
MPLNIVVIAIIALLVLVVLGWIFSTQAGRFVHSLDSCQAKKGHCMSPNTACASNETIFLTADCKYVPETKGKTEGQCCISVFG